MQGIKNWIIGILTVATIGGAIIVAVSPAALTVSAATPATSATGGGCVEYTFFGFPTWYRGLASVDSSGKCNIDSPSKNQAGLSGFIWKIVLNIIDIALRLVGYICVGFIIYGGFIYLTSAGSPDRITNAKKTLTNAIIGLVLSFASIGIVNVIAGAIN